MPLEPAMMTNFTIFAAVEMHVGVIATSLLTMWHAIRSKLFSPVGMWTSEVRRQSASLISRSKRKLREGGVLAEGSGSGSGSSGRGTPKGKFFGSSTTISKLQQVRRPGRVKVNKTLVTSTTSWSSKRPPWTSSWALPMFKSG